MTVQTSGCFTTFRSDISTKLLNAHYQRLVETCLAINLEIEFGYEDIAKLVEQVRAQYEDIVIIKIIYDQNQLKVDVRTYKPATIQTLKTIPKPTWWGNLKRYPNNKQLNTLTRARECGADDYLLVDCDCCLETVVANIFYLKNNQIYTPKLNEYILSGITRGQIIDNFDVIEREVKLKDIYNADLVFSCNGGRGLAFISKIDMQEYDLEHMNNQTIINIRKLIF